MWFFFLLRHTCSSYIIFPQSFPACLCPPCWSLSHISHTQSMWRWYTASSHAWPCRINIWPLYNLHPVVCNVAFINSDDWRALTCVCVCVSSVTNVSLVLGSDCWSVPEQNAQASVFVVKLLLTLRNKCGFSRCFKSNYTHTLSEMPVGGVSGWGMMAEWKLQPQGGSTEQPFVRTENTIWSHMDRLRYLFSQINRGGLCDQNIIC